MVTVMFVGVFHLAGGRDNVNVKVGDVDDGELAAIAGDLARFAPTKVVLEHSYADRDALAAAYADWRAGRREPAADESERLGFRIAAAAGLDTVEGIDVMHRFHEPELDALTAADPAARAGWDAAMARATRAAAVIESTMAHHGLRAALIATNTQRARATDLAVYAGDLVALVGDVPPPRPDGVAYGGYAGADVVGNWYHRNIRIFANLVRVTAPGDRLLVIYGAGHVPVLAHLAAASGRYTEVDPLPYLTPSI